MKRVKRTLSACTAALALAGAACSAGDDTAPGSGPTATAHAGGPAQATSGDPAVGKEIYGNVCSTCHGGNPSEEGPAGPAIAVVASASAPTPAPMR